MRSLLSLGVSLARFFLSDHRRGAGDFYRLRDLSLTADRSSVNDHVVIRRGRASPASPAPRAGSRRPHVLCWRSRQDLTLQPRDSKSRTLSG
jgi:hypothetical protein